LTGQKFIALLKQDTLIVIGTNIIRKNRALSTNTLAHELLKKELLPEGTIIRADEQTKGRGHAGNSWESEAGKNLTFSVLLYPQFLNVEAQFMLSKVTSLAMVDFLSETIDQSTIKWPNDIYVENDKIAGILIENSIIGSEFNHSIIGIGLNVNQTHFLSDAPNPISMRLITGTTFDLEEALHSLCEKLEKRYTQLINNQVDEIDQEYLSNLFRYNAFYPYRHGKDIFSARITGVDPFGALILETKTGEIRKYRFREIDYMLE